MSKKYKILNVVTFKRVLIFVLLTVFQTANAQLYFPNENFYNSEIERLNLSNDSVNFYQKHLSIKPILDKKTNSEAIYQTEGKYYYWITQKLFKENFLVFKGDDFWVAVDPIVDVQLGTDLAEDTLRKLYWNTRGVRVQAKFYDKVAFTTSVYESQAIVPTYQADFFDANGEYHPSGNSYKQVNAFVPMYARTKPFKVNGYDFAFATGQLSIVPTKWLNFQLGNGNQFIGDGYRSLFLSGFSGNYPFFKTEFLAFNGRLQYNVIYALLTNPYRLKYFTTPESTYERKIGVFHHLDYTVTKRLNISLFEGSNWRNTDSTGTHQPDFLFANPIIGLNSILKGTKNNGYNSIFGVGASYNLPKLFNIKGKIYTQLLIDNNIISASQIGFKLYNLFIPKLDFRAEYNTLIVNSYLSHEKRYNYTHNNLSLAHPLGGGTKELIGILNYQYKRFFASNKTVYYAHLKNDYYNVGAEFDQPLTPWGYTTSYYKKVFINRFEIGYRMNKNYNLQVALGYLYRNEIVKSTHKETNYIYFAIRTKLFNKTLDW